MFLSRLQFSGGLQLGCRSLAEPDNNNLTPIPTPTLQRHATTTSSTRPWLFLALTFVFLLVVSQNDHKVSGSLEPINPNKLKEWFTPYYNIYPDAYLDPPAFIRSRQFQEETHYVVTRDNYVITVHRVINPAVPLELRSQLKPVILQHGVFTSSFNFIIGSDVSRDKPRFDPRDLHRTRPINSYQPSEPFSLDWLLETLNDYVWAKLGLTEATDSYQAPHVSNSLAFEMANQGYDVWMPNFRGSTYSLNHTMYDYRHDWRYWDFSFHEMALYDLPATIDYVLEQRQRPSLAYVGHSQGNLAMFILQSLQPHWADKIKPFVAMAPIAFLPDVYFGLVRRFVRLISPVVTPKSLNRMIKGQLFPKNDLTIKFVDFICVPKWSEPACDVFLKLILGSNLKRTNHSLTPIVTHHIPEGTSILNMLHFGQMIGDGEFRSFDFGPKENLQKYGSPINPYYPIRNIRSPDIALISSLTDTLATVKNVKITRSMLNVPLLDDYLVPDLVWGHSDYMYAIGAGRLANIKMIELCDRYRMVP